MFKKIKEMLAEYKKQMLIKKVHQQEDEEFKANPLEGWKQKLEVSIKYLEKNLSEDNFKQAKAIINKILRSFEEIYNAIPLIKETALKLEKLDTKILDTLNVDAEKAYTAVAKLREKKNRLNMTIKDNVELIEYYAAQLKKVSGDAHKAISPIINDYFYFEVYWVKGLKEYNEPE